MSERAASAKRLTQWIVGYMAVGPIAVAIDLAWHVFPNYPAIESMRSSGPLAHSAWIACGLLAVITVILLQVKPRQGYLSLVVLVAAYAPVYFTVWHQPVLTIYWLSLAAIGFGTYAVFKDER